MNAVIRRNPVREMMTLRGALDRMFDDSFFAPFRQDELVDWGLPLDVLEKDDNFIVKASVPGINPNELDITLENDVLTIKGESLARRKKRTNATTCGNVALAALAAQSPSPFV